MEQSVVMSQTPPLLLSQDLPDPDGPPAPATPVLIFILTLMEGLFMMNKVPVHTQKKRSRSSHDDVPPTSDRATISNWAFFFSTK